MKIKYTPVFSRIIETTKEEKKAADKALSIRHPAARHMSAYQDTAWNGKIRFIKNRKFLSGLIPRLQQYLESRGFSLKIDRSVDPDLPWKTPTSDFLQDVDARENQLRLVIAGLEKKRGVLAAPPGAGKTEMMAFILEALRRGNPKGKYPVSLILAPSKNLVKQTRERVEWRLNRNVGVIQESRFLPQDITVGSPQTIYSGIKRGREDLLAYLETVQVLLIDEVQTFPATSFQTVGEAIPAIYRLGVSATAFSKTDPIRNMVLEGLAGPILEEITWREQIDAGYNAVPHIYFYTVKDNREDYDQFDPREAYVEGAIFSKAKLRMILKKVQEVVDAGLLTMILVEYVDHGDMLQELLEDAGIDVRFINRKNCSDRYVDRAIDDFRAGKLAVLISTRVFGTGQDIPAAEVLVMAAEGVKYETVVQNVGRVARKKKGLNRCIVIEFQNENNRYMRERSKGRRKTYESIDGFVVHEDDSPLELG